jgi:cytochrome c
MWYRFLPICLLFAIAFPMEAVAQEEDAAAGVTIARSINL